MSSFDTLIILGAGGHGRVIADIARALGCYSTIAFLADAPPEENFPFPFYGATAKYTDYLGKADFIIGIGNNKIRRHFQEQLSEQNASFATLIHPAAIIGSQVSIDEGTVAMPGAILNTGAKIGRGVILNTASSVDHDCTIGDFCHIAPGSHLCGTVQVGSDSMVGAGATVINNLVIPSHTILGAGAVLVHSITKPGTYIGVPACLHQ